MRHLYRFPNTHPYSFIVLLLLLVVALIVMRPSMRTEEERHIEYALMRERLLVATKSYLVGSMEVQRFYQTECLLYKYDFVRRLQSGGSDTGGIVRLVLVRDGESDITPAPTMDDATCGVDDILEVDSVVFARFFRLLYV